MLLNLAPNTPYRLRMSLGILNRETNYGPSYLNSFGGSYLYWELVLHQNQSPKFRDVVLEYEMISLIFD